MRFRVVIVIAILLVFAGGCAATRKPYLRPAVFTEPVGSAILSADPIHGIESAETSYARGVELEDSDSPDCVAHYLHCALTLWPLVSTDPEASFNNREAILYRSAVGKIVEASQRFDLLDHEQQRIQISSGFIPVRRIGFPWRAAEVGQITVVGDYLAGKGIHPVRQNGVGVPLLMQITTERPFVFPDEMKSATAIVRPDAESGCSLNIVNTSLIREIRIADRFAAQAMDEKNASENAAAAYATRRSTGRSNTLVNTTAKNETPPGHCLERYRQVPITFDLTAPMAYFNVKRDDTWKTGFLRPGKGFKDARLSMVEPYQPGKIPVVFVHGLASDPMTWAAMANELFAHVDILETAL